MSTSWTDDPRARRTWNKLLWAVFLISLAPPLTAQKGPNLGPAEIQIEISPTIEAPENTLIEFWTRTYKEDGTPLLDHHPVPMPNRLTFHTARGRTSELWIEAEGWWSPKAVAPANERSAQQTLQVFPTAKIVGSFKAAPDVPGPPEIYARFEQAAATKTEFPIPRSMTSCVVEGRTFSCEVPAGTVDLRLKADGFVAHYFWELRLRKGSSHSVGELLLKRGASVVGTVEDGATGLPVSGALVELQVDPFRKSGAGRGEQQVEKLALSAKTGERGFFQISGVNPGQYQVQAAKEKIGETNRPGLQIFEGKELTLNRPLVLLPPAILEVAVTPSHGLDEKPWRLSVTRLRSRGSKPLFLQRVAEEPGLWRRRGLPHGSYLLTIADTRGEIWAAQEVSLSGADRRQEIQLDLFSIAGQITLEGEPVTGTLWFGGRNGSPRLRMDSTADDGYVGVLPRAGEWPVDLEAPEKSLRRRYRSVEVPSPVEGWTKLDFDLTDLRIEGTIKDSKGRGTRGFVLLSSVDSRTDQLFSDEQGAVEARGLAEGKYYAQAFVSGGTASSELVEFVLDKESSPKVLDFKIEESLFFEGLVSSEWGGVPGALVLAKPGTDAAPTTLLTSQANTDAAGSFRLTLPKGTHFVDVVVAAPGYGLKAVRLPAVAGNQPQGIRVFREAGSLRIRFSAEVQPEEILNHYRLEQNSIEISTAVLTSWTQTYTDPSEPSQGTLVIPMMEFGAYAWCRNGSAPERCQRKALAPFGEASFDAQ